MIALTIFLFNITNLSGINAKFICTKNQTIPLQSDTVYFIESPNFPRSMTDDESLGCYFNFTKSLSIGEINKRFLFVLTNVYNKNIFKSPSNYTILKYQPFYYFNLEEYSAFQGYVLFDDWNDDCYLESVSRVDPYYFSDETQIISLKNGPVKFQNKSHTCLWQFKAPIGYGFKIFLDKFTSDDVTRFSISNAENAIANEKNVKTNFPYYSYNNYLKVTSFFEKGHLTDLSAYITIFKLQFNMIDANCTTTTLEAGIEKWTNILDDNSGYLNNAKCSYKSVIKPFTEILVSFEQMYVEAFVDHIYFYFNGYDSVPIDVSGMLHIDPFSPLSLYPYSDNTERTVNWEFKSDGSIQSLGFSLIFQEISCSCNDSIIIVPCEDTLSFNLMNRTDGYYCGNLNCNFTIILDSKCNNTKIMQIEILITPEGQSDIFDVFRIFADNITVLEINHLNHYYKHIMFLYSNSSNIFQALTAPNFYAKTISINLNAFIAPTNVSNFLLTNAKPYFAYNLCENEAPNLFNIELSPELILQNASIEIYSSLVNIEEYILFLIMKV